eukprot:CAMPEP_0119043512 /NCGR_PEP_ID=MMETSP1177-20130426/22837_1 /TAXON_ID=2985 /ORGANISM="Ochromonas sp, Strain CCMP1899" /LENGTH=146 /DNA_ID=CAMNT_0007011753 /DNA_START=53 /DNA_END=493 /DNA_ORIENTATION=+
MSFSSISVILLLFITCSHSYRKNLNAYHAVAKSISATNVSKHRFKTAEMFRNIATRMAITESNDLGTSDDSEMKGEVISCETTGSCGSIRRAFKQELNEQREMRRKNNEPIEENYLDLISGNKTPVKKDYSPFKKQQPKLPVDKLT